MLANLLIGFVVILVGVNLMPVVSYQVQLAQVNLTDNAAASAILGLVTIFFALSIMVAGVAIAVSGLRQAGLV